MKSEYENDPAFLAALREEGMYTPPDEVLLSVLDACTPLTMAKKRAIIAKGERNSNIYIIRDGIVRISYFDGDREITPGFASTGTFMLSPLSFMADRPAHYGFYTCTECQLLRLSRSDFHALVDTYPTFGVWMLNIALRQFCAFEMKSENMSGMARESYDRIINGKYIRMFNEFNRNHPDIRNLVSSKDLAAYLGIKPSTLSNIRKEILNDQRRRPEEP